MQIGPICCELLQGEEGARHFYSVLNFPVCVLKLELAAAAAPATKQGMLAGEWEGSEMLWEVSLGL